MSKNIKTASETAILLGQQAEAVCQHYLSNGHRAGNYWIIGNIHNEKGRSMYVRLSGTPSGPHAAGKWTEYVAWRIMLRICDWVLFHRRLAVSTQHNSSVFGEVL